MASLKNRFLNARWSLQNSLQLHYPLVYGALRKFRGDHFQLASFEYPVSNKYPRYGYGKPPHPGLLAMIETRRESYRSAIGDILQTCAPLRDVPEHAPASGHGPYWRNAWFSGNDSLVLYAWIAQHEPGTLMEIGSGNSTKFARRAVSDHRLKTQIVSIDPQPRAEIDALCDRVIRNGLETVDLQVFSALEPGDILSFDGSHRSFMNTDVTAFFLDVLPNLAPGVLVHIHDIFIPDDYPPGTPYFNEQYLLSTYLLCTPGVKVLMPNAFVANDRDLSAPMLAFWRELGLDERLFPGNSFWFVKEA